MTETLMALFADWGPPGLALMLAVNCLGVPFPTSLVMLAIGAMAAEGDVDVASVMLLGIAGAVAGDQAGYWIGRRGGAAAAERQAARFGAVDGLRRARAVADRWGGPGVFLTRWLLSPLGPYVNLAAGVANFPWLRFTLWGVAGEMVWVSLYVGLGAAFSGSVQALADLVGNLTWFLVSAGAALLLGWILWRSRHHRPAV